MFHEEELDVLPDYRITCIFIDKTCRRRGRSAVVLRGALDLIATEGGGIVEGYPYDNAGTKKSVVYDGSRALFERAGFECIRSCVMRRTCPEPSRRVVRRGSELDA